MVPKSTDLFGVAYFFCVLIALLIVYLIIKRNNRKLRWGDIFYLGNVFVISVALVGLYGLLYFTFKFKTINRPFDEGAWSTDQEHRIEMVEDLIKSKRLIGKTRTEVEFLLGPPAIVVNKKDKTKLFYYTGYKNKFLEVEPFFLDIELDLQDHKVMTYYSKAEG